MSTSFRSRALPKSFLVVLAFSLLQAAPVAGQEEPGAVVTEAAGLAFNYYTDVSLFGGPSNVRGYGQPADAPATAASPSVECPEGGGMDSAHDPDGARAVYGPAVIFGGIWPWPDSPTAPPSGPMTSSIDCELGEDGYVTASTLITLMPGATRVGGHRPDEGGQWVEPTPTWSSDYPHPGGIGPGPLIADEVESTCTMTADGTVTSDVRFVNGFVETSYNPDTQDPATWEDIPAHPEPGLQIEGTIDHVGDSFRITFNEQTENPDGSFTVVAAHMELLGPVAVGDMFVGSSTCGPLSTTDPTDPTDPTDGVCPADLQPAGFADRDTIPAAHRTNVDCAAMLDVIRGFAEDNTYRPRAQVRRDQMASFIARGLEAVGVELPPAASARFGDVPPGSTHDTAIHRLAAAEIVQGGPGGLPANSYGPALQVRRDQMASFLIRAAEFATEQALASESRAFADVPPNNPHFANVNGAAESGLAQGFGDNTYRPGELVRRDQMSSFIIRLLDEISSE